MKQVGVTSGGTLLVECTVTEAKQIQEFGAVFYKLPAFPGQEPSSAPCPDTDSGALARKPRVKRVKAAQARPVRTGALARMCGCGKHKLHGLERFCAECRRERARKRQNEAYRKLHPNAARRFPAPNPAPAARPAPVAGQALSREDRIDLIRRTAEKVSRLREEEGG